MAATSTQTRSVSNPTAATTIGVHASNTTLLLLAFGAVYIIWGSTYFAIRVGVESVPPLVVAGLRHFIFGVLFYPFLRWKTGIRPTWEHWRTAIITGFLLLFIGNGGVCIAETTVPSGMAALLVATVSLWMVLVDWLRPSGTRPVTRVLFGILLGFAGVVLLVGPKQLGGSERVSPSGVAILLIASFAWACGSIYSKHAALPPNPLMGAAMQGLCGGVILWVSSFFTGELQHLNLAAISARSWLAIGYLVFFGSMMGFTAYVYVLKNSNATRVATYALVNPVVALFLGWMFAGESITARTLLATAVILAAVLLVITAPLRRVAPHPSAPITPETAKA
jgi:drug/metabolite transporter (DMT)-like permease